VLEAFALEVCALDRSFKAFTFDSEIFDSNRYLLLRFPFLSTREEGIEAS